MSFLHFYYTPRSVGIHHPKLGLLYWSFVMLAFVYTLVAVFHSKNYLEYDHVSSAVSMKLHWKTEEINTATYPYCAPSSNPDGSKRPCNMWDKFQVGQALSENTYFIVTKVKEIAENRTCAQNATVCNLEDMWIPVSKKTFFIPGVDSASLGIRHSFTASNFFEDSHDPLYSQTNSEMRGVFVTGKSSDDTFQILQRFESTKSDLLPLKDLLTATEMDLDGPSHQVDEKRNANQTYRNTGFTVLLDLHYNNVACRGDLWKRFVTDRCFIGTVKPTYRYRATATPSPITVQNIIQEDLQNGLRVRRTLHGIVVKVQQGGKIGRFSIAVLLMQIAAGLGFFSLATMLVDNISYYLLVGEKFERSKYVYYDHTFVRQQLAVEEKAAPVAAK